MNDITIDKTGWKKYRFDEMVQNISERVEPGQTDLDVYVGLEHIDPDSLHIKRHGHPSDVEGTKLRFYKGDIIFGRRRAYQRKTALATTDGICSAHAMVLRAKEDVVDPMFLPFLFHSKSFIDMAITISVGGLSPTINWKDIAKQEFLLPPKPEQKRIAALLWSADEMIEKEKMELQEADNYFNYQKTSLIWRTRFPLGRLKDVTSIGLKDGDWIESKDQSESGIRLIQLADIGDGEFINKSSRYISEDTFNKLHCFEVFPHDILLARMPNPIGRSCIMPQLPERCITAVDVCVIRVDESNHNTLFINYMINTPVFRKKVIEQSSGTTRQRISRSNLEEMAIPLPSKDMQDSIVGKISRIEKLIISFQKQIGMSELIKQEIINKTY